MDGYLRIALDRTRATVGEKVGGTVFVDRAMDECRKLDVALEWSGKLLGRVKASSATLHLGPIRAGQSFPFELEVPAAAPFTFTGHKHTIEWHAKASADVPWAIDPKVDEKLVVEPRVVETDAELEEATRVAAPADRKLGPIGSAILWTIVGIAIVAAFPLLPIVLILIARKQLLRTRLTDFSIEGPDRPLVLGQWVPVVLTFRLKRAIDVARITLTLRGTEQWSTGSGKSRTTHFHHFHEETVTLLENRIIAPVPATASRSGGPYRSSGRSRARSGPVFAAAALLRLPIGGRPTISGSVYYKLSAKAELRGWPDPTAERPVKTVGARLAAERPRAAVEPVEETSGDLAFLRPGDQPPPGVDVRTAGAGVGGWIALVAVGMIATAWSLFAWMDSPFDVTAVLSMPALLGSPFGVYLLAAAAGLLATVGGVAGFLMRLYR